MNPSVSIICCTFGRTQFLPATLAMFAAQDYAGPLEMILLNSFPDQKIVNSLPNLKIINLDERPKSLGECRNKAIEAASGEIILQLDDDDAILPHHVSSIVKHFKPGLSWIWLASMFHSEKGQIQKIVQGNISCFAYTKEAWNKVGGFSPLTVGEDKSFIGKLSSLPGEKIEVTPSEISFIYGWDNNSPHISGLGTDEQRGGSSHEWAAKELAKRVKSGSEPTGVIVLPAIQMVDWTAEVDAFLAAKSLRSLKNEVCIVLLGRHGDLINLLPIAKLIHDNFKTPYWMVSKEFAQTLEGVSYVTPYPVDLNNNQLNKALELAEREFKFVLTGQIWGANVAQIRATKAYNMDSWNNCGMLHKFHDKTMLPLFDQRDAKREAELVNYCTGGGKHKIILVQTSKSVSSPWGFGAKLMELIASTFADRYRIVDLSNVTVHRIYDLIGLMDAAECLVTCDSAPLHLAAASDVPVIALVNPMPWLGTEPRCLNLVKRFTYAEAEKDAVAVIHAIESAVHESRYRPAVEISPAIIASTKGLFHAYAPYERPLEMDRKRVDEAQASWNYIYDVCRVGKRPYPQHIYRRSSDKEIGDPRVLPYLKDVLAQAMMRQDEDSIIFFTNDDIWLHPELPDLIRFHVSVYGVCTSRRCEIPKLLPEGATPEDYAKAHLGHIGRDLFAATKAWLVANWDRIPDFLIGASRFDMFLAYLVRYNFGLTLEKIASLEADAWPAELPVGFIAHVAHQNEWSTKFHDSPAEKHNKRLYEENLPKVIGRKV